MNNEQKIKAVECWQKSCMVHELTCGNDSGHTPLVAVECESGDVVLKCPDCDYTQEHIPKCVMMVHPRYLEMSARELIHHTEGLK